LVFVTYALVCATAALAPKQANTDANSMIRITDPGTLWVNFVIVTSPYSWCAERCRAGAGWAVSSKFISTGDPVEAERG
jgi:hypothetical protein